MDKDVAGLFGINQFSSGRRLSLYNLIERGAQERGDTAIVAYVQRARAHDMWTRELDDRWAAPARRTLYGREVVELDQQIDPLVTQIRDVCEAQIADLPVEDPLYEQVSSMLADVFPAGVAAITSLPYIDEVAAVENLLTKLQGPFAPVMATLALTRKVARLAELTRSYREAIDQTGGPLDYDTVRRGRARGHAYLLELIAMIVGVYHDSDNPDHVAAREELLRPIIDHNEAVRAVHRSRRARGDAAIDGPESGLDEDVFDEEADSDTGAIGDDPTGEDEAGEDASETIPGGSPATPGAGETGTDAAA